MPLVETEGLVIKSYNLAEADRIVVFLTRDHGVVRGVAKGAKRLKSKFGSGLEPFAVVNLTYFQKDAVELVSIQRSDVVRSYFAAASQPDFLQKFSYLGDLLAAFSPPHDPNETLYRMARACLEATADSPENLASVGAYFELWLLRLAGYLPDWSKCNECRRVFDDIETADVRANFHLICANCRRSSGPTADAVQRKLYSFATRLSPVDFAAFARTEPASVAGLSATLKRIIAQAIGRESVAEKTFAVNN
jgi:DNA repair protein RecO (recombination protein O)